MIYPLRSVPVFLMLLTACSIRYDSDTMDLGFYQWNFWTEPEASSNGNPGGPASGASGGMVAHPPSCGWEELHLGNGKPVRIPATAGEHFSPDYKGVCWFHVRFTLPESWAARDIAIEFEGTSGMTEVYLNEELVGGQMQGLGPFSVDVTGTIYYKRDNHLDIRICDPDPGRGGITGKIILKSDPTTGKSHGSQAS
jgi:hypothetical protein